MVAYENACVCGKRFDNNCAHFLTNWLIRNCKMESKLAGCYCCESGRPIRAKELRENYYIPNFNKTFNDPGTSCFIYCEKAGRGHVYYGTKTECVAGTGLWKDATYYEFYTEK